MPTFYIDTDIAEAVVRLLRRAGFDVVTARSRGLRFATDDEHLLQATREGRVLVSHNAKDFFLLYNAWRSWTREWGVDVEHAPIVVLSQRRLALEMAGALLDLVNRVVLVPGDMYAWSPLSEWQRKP